MKANELKECPPPGTRILARDGKLEGEVVRYEGVRVRWGDGTHCSYNWHDMGFEIQGIHMRNPAYRIQSACANCQHSEPYSIAPESPLVCTLDTERAEVADCGICDLYAPEGDDE